MGSLRGSTIESFLDGFTGAGFFGRLRWPGSPTYLVDPRGLDEFKASGDYDCLVEQIGLSASDELLENSIQDQTTPEPDLLAGERHQQAIEQLKKLWKSATPPIYSLWEIERARETEGPVESVNVRGLLPEESEDARIIGSTRSLFRRLLALNLPGGRRRKISYERLPKISYERQISYGKRPPLIFPLAAEREGHPNASELFAQKPSPTEDARRQKTASTS